MYELLTSAERFDITPVDDLCPRCRAELHDDYYHYVDLCNYPQCYCHDTRKYEYSFVKISVSEIKDPTNSVFVVSVYISNEEITEWYQPCDPKVTFSINKTMDGSSDMKEILLKYSTYIQNINNYGKPNTSFHGTKPVASYIKEFMSLYESIINHVQESKELKTNPHMKQKSKSKK